MWFVEPNRLVSRRAYADAICESAANRSADDLRMRHWWEKDIERRGDWSNDDALLTPPHPSTTGT